MVLILLVTLLILGIAFYQVLQGLYSALIMLLLTIISAMVAFNYYLPITEALQEYMTVYTAPVVLVSLFALVLFALRLAFDRFLGANVVLGTWADRIGGGVFGLFTGMILTGVLTIGMQMLPFNESVLTYKPFDEYLQRNHRFYPFCPDEFTLGLMGNLSAGSMSGDKSFDDVHDDLLFREFCSRNTAGKNGGKMVLENSFQKLEFYASLPAGINAGDVPTYHLAERGPQKFIIARTTFSRELADADGWWRIPGTHVQLHATGEKDESYSYYPVGFLSSRDESGRSDSADAAEWQLHTLTGDDVKCKLAELIVARERASDQDSLTIDWVYSIGAGQEPNGVTLRSMMDLGVDQVRPSRPPAENALTRPRRR